MPRGCRCESAQGTQGGGLTPSALQAVFDAAQPAPPRYTDRVGMPPQAEAAPSPPLSPPVTPSSASWLLGRRPDGAASCRPGLPPHAAAEWLQGGGTDGGEGPRVVALSPRPRNALVAAATLPPRSPPASPPAEAEAPPEEDPDELALELKGRGVVRVHLHGARDLKAADVTAKALSPKGENIFGGLFEHRDKDEHHDKDDRDTFCELALGQHTLKSETVRQTLHPQWDQHFSFRGEDGPDNRFSLAEIIAAPLTLACYDEDRGFFGGDESSELGYAAVDLGLLLRVREVRLACQCVLGVQPTALQGQASRANLAGLAGFSGWPHIYIHICVCACEQARLTVPLSPQGSVSLTISWEMEEEFEAEVDSKAEYQNLSIEEQLAWELGITDISALGLSQKPAAAPAAAPRRLSKAWRAQRASSKSLQRLTQPKKPKKPKKPKAPRLRRKDSFSKKSKATPDMLSLSISISILVKFILFDLVGYFQVNSALVLSMPDVEFPQGVKDISSTLSDVFNLSFLTEWGEANCSLGGNQCFRVLLIMLTLVGFQLAFPAAVTLARWMATDHGPLRTRLLQARLDTLVDRSIHGNAVVLMILHPVISKQLVGLVDCTYYNDVNVLSEYKTVRGRTSAYTHAPPLRRQRVY